MSTSGIVEEERTVSNTLCSLITAEPNSAKSGSMKRDIGEVLVVSSILPATCDEDSAAVDEEGNTNTLDVYDEFCGYVEAEEPPDYEEGGA